MNKLKIAGIALIIFAWTLSLSAQNFEYYFLGGANFCQIDGDQMAGYNKLGFRAGFGVYLNNDKNDEYGFELTYALKGARTALNPDNPAQLIVRYNYSYLEVPFFYEKKFKEHFGLRVALAPAYLISAQADLGGGFREQENVRSFEVSGMIGPTYTITENWSAYIHYQYSVASIIDLQRSQVPGANFRRTGVYNHLISAGLRYKFTK